MVRPCPRLAPAHRYAQCALLRCRHRVFHCSVQLLRLERDKVCERDSTQLDRYVQDPCHMDRQLGIRLGDPDVANLTPTGRWLRPVGLWHGA